MVELVRLVSKGFEICATYRATPKAGEHVYMAARAHSVNRKILYSTTMRFIVTWCQKEILYSALQLSTPPITPWTTSRGMVIS